MRVGGERGVGDGPSVGAGVGTGEESVESDVIVLNDAGAVLMKGVPGVDGGFVRKSVWVG